jgi:hypothetical protein
MKDPVNTILENDTTVKLLPPFTSILKKAKVPAAEDAVRAVAARVMLLKTSITTTS